MGKVGSGFEMRVTNQRTGNARLTIGDSRISDGDWVCMVLMSQFGGGGGGDKGMGIPLGI